PTRGGASVAYSHRSGPWRIAMINGSPYATAPRTNGIIRTPSAGSGPSTELVRGSELPHFGERPEASVGDRRRGTVTRKGQARSALPSRLEVHGPQRVRDRRGHVGCVAVEGDVERPERAPQG